LTWELASSGSLSGKIWRLEYFRSFENFGLDCVRLQSDIQTPLLDLFTL